MNKDTSFLFFGINFNRRQFANDFSRFKREDAIDNFRAGKTWVLIATDVVARGRSGRAGRSGEAVTFYTEVDIPFLRNIANVMAASGCDVPAWIMFLQKKKWRKHRPERNFISTKPIDEED